MDRTSKCLCILLLGGVITLGIGTTYIPQMGGTVPEGMTTSEFTRQQQSNIYNSNGFKITMIGTGVTVASLIIMWIRLCIYEYREALIIRNEVYHRERRSILKVKRATIVPQETINVIVDDPPQQTDPKPHIRTTPNLIPLSAPSSSPPIQLIPGSKKVNFMELQPYEFKGPVVEKIKLNGNFKYPRPYDGVRNG